MRKVTDLTAISKRISAFGFAGKTLALLAGMALLTLMSALTYRAVLGAERESDAQRAATGYAKTQIASLDTEDAVSVRNGSLVLLERAEGESYEVRLYVKDGVLCEEYAPVGESGAVMELTPCEGFSAELVRDGLLRLEVNGEETYVALFASEGVTE